MSLLDTAKKLIVLRSRPSSEEVNLDAVYGEYIEALQVADKGILMKALELDINFDLPIDLRKMTHEKLIEYERSPQFLFDYAYFLFCHGPDWDDLAYELQEEAKRLQDSMSSTDSK